MTGAWDLAFIYNVALENTISHFIGLSHLIHIDTDRKLSDSQRQRTLQRFRRRLSIGEAEAVGLCAKSTVA
jgi:hypothetical protein